MKKYCQTNEDVIIDGILKELGIETGFAVEFGGGNGYRLSNIRHLADRGWKIFQMDVDNQGNDEVVIEFLTVENINSVFAKHNLTDIDVLSIDIDGNDYWIWQFLDELPKVVVVEWNPSIQGCKAIKYNPDHKFNRTDYYGASWEAFRKLGDRKGYTLVECNGLNMFFVKNELLTNELEKSNKRLKKPAWNNRKRGWPHDKKGEWVDVS